MYNLSTVKYFFKGGISLFSERLNFVRKSKGYTAQQMADYLSMGLRAYRNYESGNRFPSADALIKIADKLDVSIDYYHQNLVP